MTNGRYTSSLAEVATVTIECYNYDNNLFSTGSGFFIDSQGTIVTAYHVIEGAYSIKICMYDSSEYTVQKIVGFDKGRDIAIIQISGSASFQYLELETEGVTPGETAYSLGSSLGFLEGSFGAGVVSSDLRKMIIDEETKEFMYYVQFTAPVSPGNSGGPLINAYGRVIGIVQAGYTQGDNLNIAAYIKELDKVNQTYNLSVSLFFEDTQYFRIKMGMRFKSENESNNSVSTADNISSGDTFYGVTKAIDYDVFKLNCSGTEAVDFTIAFCVSEDSGTIYYPSLYDSEFNEISLTWEETINNENDRVYYAWTSLNPGSYYIQVEGYYSSNDTIYSLYTYWRPLSELNDFKYEVYETDFLS